MQRKFNPETAQPFDFLGFFPYGPCMSSPSSAHFERLLSIMEKLRSPDGCPWDREQTFQSITPHTLEEAHEVVEAIEKQNFEGLAEELGDLLLQVIFYAQMAAEEKRFTIDDVLQKLCDKLVRRHPHVFGDKKIHDSKTVLQNWEEIKKTEGKKSVLDGVPKNLPALLRASRLGEKTSRVGFDFPNIEGVLEKIAEEIQEFKQAQTSRNSAAEFGDLLFSLVNYARFLNIDAEGSLRQCTDRFISRFQWIEQEAQRTHKHLKDFTPQEWDDLWTKAKEKQPSL